MRFTRKYKNSYNVNEYYTNSKISSGIVYIDDNKNFTNACIAKLGHLEDIEEELGIDLITLFKALKDGIWIKKTSSFDEVFYYKEKVSSFSFYFKEIYVEHECEYQYPYALKDYGKTWALDKKDLTKEELL